MITLEVRVEEAAIFDPLREKFQKEIKYYQEEESFDGVTIMQMVIELTEVTLPLIASIIIAKINTKNSITVKCKNGTEITANISEAKTLEQVETLLLLKCKDDDD